MSTLTPGGMYTNEPPDQTAEFSAANLLSWIGMIVPKYSRTRSGCSRRAVSVSTKITPFFWQVLAEAVVDDLRLVLGADAGEELALGLGDAQLVEGVLDVGRHVVPGLALAVGGLHVVVDVVEVQLGRGRRPRSGVGFCQKTSSALRRNSRIHCGSFFISEICSTISRSSPLPLLNE